MPPTEEQIREVKERIRSHEARRAVLVQEAQQLQQDYEALKPTLSKDSEPAIRAEVEFRVQIELRNREYRQLAREILKLYRSIPPMRISTAYSGGRYISHSSHEDPDEPGFYVRHYGGGN